MKRTLLALFLSSLAIPSALTAQFSYPSFSLAADPASMGGGAGQAAPVNGRSIGSQSAFTKVAVGAGVSPLGIQLQVATNINPHVNLRATGNFFSYSTNFTTNGINANAKLSLGSAGAAVDLYPTRFGLRVSPGLLFVNQNQLSATANVAGGTSFTLNDVTYYSANANSSTGATPITGNATLGLNTTKPAFTLTTGWGNMIPRKGHLSFPFELGVAFIGAPSLNVNLGGWACDDQAQTQCSSITDTSNSIAAAVQSNLTSQVAKYTKDLNPLKTYPIVSVGVAYSFKVR